MKRLLASLLALFIAAPAYGEMVTPATFNAAQATAEAALVAMMGERDAALTSLATASAALTTALAKIEAAKAALEG